MSLIKSAIRAVQDDKFKKTLEKNEPMKTFTTCVSSDTSKSTFRTDDEETIIIDRETEEVTIKR